MRTECITAIEQALGRQLKPGEEMKYENAIATQKYLLARRDPETWRSTPNAQRNILAAQAAAEKLVADAAKVKSNLELQIAAHDRIENLLSQAFDRLDPEKEKPGDRMRVASQILAQDVKARGIQSAESWGKAVKAESLGRLQDVFDAAGGKVWGLFHDPQGILDIEKELHGESSGNPEAAKAVKAWRSVATELKNRANAAGQHIGTLSDDVWAKPQNHSASRIGKAGLDDWSNFVVDKLDRKMYVNDNGTLMTNEQLLTNVLPKTFDSIITDGMSDKDLGKNFKNSIENRNAQHRGLFFKDAQASIDYQAKYGKSDLLTTMVNHVNKLSTDIGMMEMLGPNPEKTFNYFNERTALDSKRLFPSEQKAIDAETKFNSALYDRVSGRNEVVNQKVADWFQAYRNLSVATKLSSVVITALGDEAAMYATAAANKVNYGSVLGQEAHYLNPANAEDRAVARGEGVGHGGMLGEVNRFGAEHLTGGIDTAAGRAKQVTSKIATAVMKLSGAEVMWDARRQGLGAIIKSKIGELTRSIDNFADINEGDHGMLAHKGVTESDWQVWKRADTEDWGSHAPTVMTPKTIWAIPDEQLKDLGDPTALKRHASTMLMSHVLEETGMGVMDTGAREQATLRLGTTSGTYGGELYRSSLLFKGFAASMMMKHWGRLASMDQGGFGYAARLGVAGTAIAAAAIQLRALAGGKNPENMADPKFWMSAGLRGGGLGYFGDFLYSEMNSHDSSLIAGLMGPIATDTEAIGKLTLGAAIKAGKGERTDEGANLLRFARGNTPLLNMWYTKAAADHLIWNNIQEASNPGYLDRMMEKARTDKGTTWFWSPHEPLPQVPDFSTAWNPEAAQESAGRWVDKVMR